MAGSSGGAGDVPAFSLIANQLKLVMEKANGGKKVCYTTVLLVFFGTFKIFSTPSIEMRTVGCTQQEMIYLFLHRSFLHEAWALRCNFVSVS